MKCAFAATCLSLWSGLALSAVAPFPSTIFVAEEATENEIAAALATLTALGSAFESAGIGADGTRSSSSKRSKADDANGPASDDGSGEGDNAGGKARPEDAFVTAEVSGV